MNPPRWIGGALIGSGLVGFVILTSPLVAAKALFAVTALSITIIGVASLASLVAASRADDTMERLDAEEIERRGRALTNKLRSELSIVHDDGPASAVIGDDFPSVGGSKADRIGGDRVITSSTNRANFSKEEGVL